jgi:hypothetical protein
MAWFTYRVFKSGETFGTLSLADRIKDKAEGLTYLVDPVDPSFDGDPNVLDVLDMGHCYVVFSEQDIPQADFCKVKWNGMDLEYVPAGQQAFIDNFLASARQMWIDRKAKINELMVEILNEDDWGNLSRQHRRFFWVPHSRTSARTTGPLAVWMTLTTWETSTYRGASGTNSESG